MAFEYVINYSYNLASFIDFLILMVAFFIFYQTKKIYHFLGEEKYKFFSWAFLSITFSYFFKILSNITILHKVIIKNSNFVILLLKEFNFMQIINFITFIAYKSFLLMGFLILFLTLFNHNKKEEIFLLTYLGFISIILSIYHHFIFHLTIFFLLLFLTNYFYKNNKKIKTKNSLFVFIAFFILFFNSTINIFIDSFPAGNFIGELILLIGFLILLLNHIKCNNGKKKNKARGNKGYFGSFKKK